ncbi:MAG TPA: type III pantothenate kinase [Candidatus Saccharimonadales bacterium]|nr:type III pantothenate kinase [Candidatus Saccharimonadales bacterium]
MLLVIDIGNTEIELGLFPLREDGSAAGELSAQWRISTSQSQTTDEYGVLIRQLFAMRGLELNVVHGIVIASVVPPLESLMRLMCERYFGVKALFIEPGIKTGMPVHYDNPAEVGADRIVNAVAAYEKCKQSCVVVDFGTATTFDAVSARGEYLGGVIAPGISISAEALFARTARLPRVDLKRPPHVIGSNTVHSLQSGLFYGYVGLVDGILERVLAEFGTARVIATGGMAPFIASGSRFLAEIDDTLTLMGLRIIWERNLHSRRR